MQFLSFAFAGVVSVANAQRSSLPEEVTQGFLNRAKTALERAEAPKVATLMSPPKAPGPIRMGDLTPMGLEGLALAESAIKKNQELLMQLGELKVPDLADPAGREVFTNAIQTFGAAFAGDAFLSTLRGSPREDFASYITQNLNSPSSAAQLMELPFSMLSSGQWKEMLALVSADASPEQLAVMAKQLIQNDVASATKLASLYGPTEIRGARVFPDIAGEVLNTVPLPDLSRFISGLRNTQGQTTFASTFAESIRGVREQPLDRAVKAFFTQIAPEAEQPEQPEQAEQAKQGAERAGDAPVGESVSEMEDPETIVESFGRVLANLPAQRSLEALRAALVDRDIVPVGERTSFLETITQQIVEFPNPKLATTFTELLELSRESEGPISAPALIDEVAGDAPTAEEILLTAQQTAQQTVEDVEDSLENVEADVEASLENAQEEGDSFLDALDDMFKSAVSEFDDLTDQVEEDVEAIGEAIEKDAEAVGDAIEDDFEELEDDVRAREEFRDAREEIRDAREAQEDALADIRDARETQRDALRRPVDADSDVDRATAEISAVADSVVQATRSIGSIIEAASRN